MYPPSAAVMLAWLSMLGSFGSLLALLLVNSAAWVISVWLSVWLSVGSRAKRNPLILIVPSLSIVVLVYNIYLLGQPNLVLLALLLGTFACLRLGRPIGAQGLSSRRPRRSRPTRSWRAWLSDLPADVDRLGRDRGRTRSLAAARTTSPFRSPAQAVDDLVVWSKGMLFTYNTNGIAQRPFRSYSYKNQSIMALAHRLLRDMPADGESVLLKTGPPCRPPCRSRDFHQSTRRPTCSTSSSRTRIVNSD